MMKRYNAWLKDTTGVSRYDDDTPGVIIVEFKNDAQYEYTDALAGPANIAEMKRLAKSGSDLSQFITRNKNDLHGRKLVSAERRI